MNRHLLTLLFVLSLPLAVNAHPFLASAKQTAFDSTKYIAQAPTGSSKAAKVQKLYELSQDVLSEKIVPVRGGTKDKLLGLYLGGKNRVIFNSGYKDVDPKTQCEWAYDLRQFIVDNGGGWDNYQKYLKEAKPGSLIQDLEDSAKNYQGGKNPNDPVDRAHVSYDKQAAFADTWWAKNSQNYKSLIVPPARDWWRHDAILDANNLWTRHEQLNDKGSSEYSSWRDAELETLMQKK